MGASRFSENKQLQEIELRHCKTESIFSLEHVRVRLFVSCVTLFFWQMIRCDQCWREACKLGLKLYYRSIHTCWDSVQVKCENQASDFYKCISGFVGDEAGSKGIHCPLKPPTVDLPAEPEQINGAAAALRRNCLWSEPWLFCQKTLPVVSRFLPARLLLPGPSNPEGCMNFLEF